MSDDGAPVADTVFEWRGTQFEWDDQKAKANIVKHGIPFPLAVTIWSGFVVEGLDDREDYGELRHLDFGMVGGRVIAVVYTWRRERRRIISARKATSDERQAYFDPG